PMAKNAVTRDGVECSLVKTISSGRCIFLQRCLTGRPRRSETAATEKSARETMSPERLIQVPVALFLAGARVRDLHGLLFLSAAVFVPSKHAMILVGDLKHFEI